MNVTLCSAFRNASGYIGRYFHQVSDLENSLFLRGDRLSAIWCEGDSTDDTWRILNNFCEGAGNITDSLYASCLFQHAHGGADFGSIVNAERFANLADVWNAIWQRIPDNADAVLFVESDLVWEPETMLALLDDLAHVPAVAPMVMHGGFKPNAYYDSWGYRKDGERFKRYPPYFDGWPVTELAPIDSAGSCIAMRGDLARQLTWPAEDVCVGVCRQIYEHGGSVWLDPTQEILHL